MLLQLRDEHLTEASDTDEYRRVTEDIYKYQTEQAEEAADARIELIEQSVKDYETQMENMAAAAESNLEEIQKAYDEVQAKQDDMANKLQDYGGLFEMKNDFMDISNLNEQIKAIEKYDEILSKLKERGLSDGLLDEVVGMGVDDATVFGEKLLKMSDKDWEKYNTAWETKSRLALETAEKFYKDQIDELTESYNKELDKFYEDLSTSAFDAGAEAVGDLADGINEKRREAIDAASELVKALKDEFNGLSITGAKADGSHAAGLSYVPYDGYLAELHKGERVLTADEAKAFVAASMPRSYDIPTPGSAQISQLQTEVRALRNQVSQNSASSETIRLDVSIPLDGEVVARKTFDYNRREGKLRGDSFVQRG